MTLVLLQLVLVESGYACQMAPGVLDSAASMADMQMPASETASTTAPAQREQEQEPCRFPWAPNGCQSMAPCAPAALTETSVAAEARTQIVAAPWHLVQVAPVPVTRAPEIPPPRA